MSYFISKIGHLNPRFYSLIYCAIPGVQMYPTPAGHALTSCDTVAKVGTKKELLHILNSFDPLITGFGREALDYDMLQQAEQFLLNVVTKKYRFCSTFDELRAKL